MTPVANDDLGGPVVVFDEAAASAAVFDRSVGGHVLTFERAPTGDLPVRDRETGSVWDGRTGAAIGGRDHYPNTDVYQPRATVSGD